MTTRKSGRAYRERKEHLGGLMPPSEMFDPSKFWGQVLPSPATTAGPDSFDARVEQAWRFMRNMFFTPEEHAAVGEAVVRLVNGGPGAAD